MKTVFLLIAAILLAGLVVVGQIETVEKTSSADESAVYEYAAPENILDFMKTLKDAGGRGYRLDKMTVTNQTNYHASSAKKQVGRTFLAGILKKEDEATFDYNFFFAEGEDDPEKTLNELAKDGWYFRDVISVYGEGDSTSLLIEDIFANRLRSIPTIGNIYLLERRTNAKKNPERNYKLLKVGVGTGRNPTPKMQALLDDAVKEGFLPVASYLSMRMTSIISIDVFNGVIVEKTTTENTTGNREYKFIRGNRNDGLQKDIAEFSKDGWRIGVLNYNTGILYRTAAAENSPVKYTWLETEEKTYPTMRDEIIARKPPFFSAVITGSDQRFNKNALIFEESSENKSADFKIVTILPKLPKQFKKKPEDFYKTIQKPEDIFNKNLSEGYIPQDIFLSDNEGLMMIFVRPEKANE
jgi:hypothetical protein